MIKWLESKFALLGTLVIKTPDLNVEGWGERDTFFLLWNPAPNWLNYHQVIRAGLKLNIYLHQSISVSIYVRTS